jgi:hypothetical protein
MTEYKTQYVIPEAQSRLYERTDFIVRVGEDEKPCFKTGQHVKRGTMHQKWVRFNTESNSDLTGRLKAITTELTQSLTSYPHLKEITMNKIIDFRNALVRIGDTYTNDGKPNVSDKINGYILTLDMCIPVEIKSKFAIPKMPNPYTSPGIVPQSSPTTPEVGPTSTPPIDIISLQRTVSTDSIKSTGSSPIQPAPVSGNIQTYILDSISAALNKLIVGGNTISPPVVSTSPGSPIVTSSSPTTTTVSPVATTVIPVTVTPSSRAVSGISTIPSSPLTSWISSSSRQTHIPSPPKPPKPTNNDKDDEYASDDFEQ